MRLVDKHERVVLFCQLTDAPDNTSHHAPPPCVRAHCQHWARRSTTPAALGQLSLASLRGRLIEYQLRWCGEGGNIISVGRQVTLCDPMWHVSSRSGVATLRTSIHLLLTYLLTAFRTRRQAMPRNQPPAPVWPTVYVYQQVSFHLYILCSQA